MLLFSQYRPGKCLLRYSRTKKALDDILERKNTVQGYNNKKFKKSKNWHFSKGVTHGCGSNMAIFESFFSGNKGQENVFYDIVERNYVFLSYKNKKSKNSKYSYFFKGVNPWFWSKNGNFSTFFFFRQYRPGKCLLWYSRTKKRLSWL